MFIESQTSYDRYGSPKSSGRFLVLMQPKGMLGYREPIRALVSSRKVKMEACGNFMMGHFPVGDKEFVVSGTYGGDGLTRSVDKEIYEQGVLLPNDLYTKWSRGGGHNSAGSEALEMLNWAKENLMSAKKVRELKEKETPQDVEQARTHIQKEYEKSSQPMSAPAPIKAKTSATDGYGGK